MPIKPTTLLTVATDKLCLILEVIRDDVEEANPNLVGFDARKLAENLIEFKNSAEPDDDEIIALAKLVKDGNFDMWECPTCEDGTMVYAVKLIQEGFDNFQAAYGLQDFSSYPGRGHSGDKRCDHCRMHMVGDATYNPDLE